MARAMSRVGETMQQLRPPRETSQPLGARGTCGREKGSFVELGGVSEAVGLQARGASIYTRERERESVCEREEKERQKEKGNEEIDQEISKKDRRKKEIN